MKSRFTAAGFVAVALVGSSGVSLAAAAPSPTPTVPTVEPYELPDTPFDGPVGGERLGEQGDVVVDATGAVPPPPVVPAASYVVVDLDTGDVLAAKDAHAPLAPASTIKTLTALTVLDNLALETTYVVKDADVRVEGSRVGILPNQSYSVDQLLHGLLLASGNDAAHALGEALGGQSQAVDLMNQEVERLGAFDTHAVNTHGLDEPGQVSSAYDLALIGREALQREEFRQLVATRTFKFPGKQGATYEIQNQNRLLGKYRGAFGVKTGYTTNAKHTFIGAAERNGHRLLVTVMKVRGRGEAAAASLLDWGFDSVDAVHPVGRLVTPEDVEHAFAPPPPTESPTTQEQLTVAGSRELKSAIAAGRKLAQTLPPWGWPVGVGAVIGMTALVRSRIRRRRRRSRGRYSAGIRERSVSTPSDVEPPLGALAASEDLLARLAGPIPPSPVVVAPPPVVVASPPIAVAPTPVAVAPPAATEVPSVAGASWMHDSSQPTEATEFSDDAKARPVPPEEQLPPEPQPPRPATPGPAPKEPTFPEPAPPVPTPPDPTSPRPAPSEPVQPEPAPHPPARPEQMQARVATSRSVAAASAADLIAARLQRRAANGGHRPGGASPQAAAPRLEDVPSNLDQPETAPVVSDNSDDPDAHQ